MTPRSAHLAKWLTAAQHAVQEVLTHYTDTAVHWQTGVHAPEHTTGAFVSLFSTGPDESDSMKVGLFASEAGCLAMAQALLGTNDQLNTDEVSDAICEMVNVLAGHMKGKLAKGVRTLKIGLPTYTQNLPPPDPDIEVTASDIAFGGRRATLLLMKHHDSNHTTTQP